ncbi:MAG: ArnT family glycosyltransferase [Thermodesulfobacteriota bacterium]
MVQPIPNKRLQQSLTLLLALHILLIMLLAAVPPVCRDALTHHLAVPKLYLRHGGIYEIPGIPFSYYPMNLELLYLLPMYFGNDIAPKYIHFGFALSTAWIVFIYLRKRTDTSHALFGALFFLTTPVVIRLSISAYVDLGLIFFSTAALLLLLHWRENRFHPKWLITSAICCGLALGTKYNGLIVLFFLTLFVPFLYVRSGQPDMPRQLRAMGLGCLFFLTALTIFSPWMIRNYIWTRNPVYPLYPHLFHSASLPSTGVRPDSAPKEDGQPADREQRKWTHFRVRKLVFNESLMETLTIPLRIFFQGKDDDPKFFDGKLNPFLLLFPFFAFWPSRSSSGNGVHAEKRLLLAFAVLYLLFVYFQIDMRIRWISPIIPPLVILSVFGLKNVADLCAARKTELTGTIGRGLLVALAVLACGINASYLGLQFDTVKPLAYISGDISRADYIRRYRPEYPVIDHANRNLRGDVKILALFLGNRIYYSDHEMDCNYKKFFKNLKQLNGPEELYHVLKANRYSHVIVRFDALEQWAETILPEKERELLALFFQRHLKKIYARDGHGLLELTSRQ